MSFRRQLEEVAKRRSVPEHDSPAARSRARRKRRIRVWADETAASREKWISKNRFYYEDDLRYMQFLVPAGAKVLEVGCGTGRLLAGLAPDPGVGIDVSPAMIDIATNEHPGINFLAGDVEDPHFLATLPGPFDVIILSDVIGYLDDVQRTLEALRTICHPDTRVIVSYFSQSWRQPLWLAEVVGLKMPQPPQNWLDRSSTESVLSLSSFEIVKHEYRLLMPRRALGIGPFVNRYLGTLPGFRALSLRHYIVARPTPPTPMENPSLSIIIPCRNEAGNIRPAIERIPEICSDKEIIFVEGHSQDETEEEIRRVIQERPDLDIRLLVQDGRGKADAVRKGFDQARGDILVILDADLTVAPEDLPKFYDVIASGRADYAQGTRLVYPRAERAMRRLNSLGNRLFARVFSWLLNERITDTLCGTKAIRSDLYRALAEERHYFGDFDPFGDFDLIFGAAKLNLKMVEIPVRYEERDYGETQISRFSDGLLLFRMAAFGFRRMKGL